MSELKASYTLEELSATDNVIEIPAVQRGLVWTPKQAEFLWDSILRGFPIGGFVVSKNIDEKFYIMDGQQRLDAIRQAYEEPNINSETIFWIDLFAKNNINTSDASDTRKFFIKVITKAHPWGFKSNNDTLTAKEQRDAIEYFWKDPDKDIYKDDFSLSDCFPWDAKFPVQLSYFLTADTSNKESFRKDVLKKIKMNNRSWKDKFWRWETSDNFKVKIFASISKIYAAFRKLDEYRIPISIFDMTSELSTETNDFKEKTELEILFTRLNTGGTQISQDDLFYSAIKAYWGTIKGTIESIAQNKLPPAKLSQLLLRLYLIVSSNHTFVKDLTLNKIRDLALNSEKEKIERFIKTKAKSLVDSIEDAFSQKEIPSFIKMKIISDNEDIYLLLLYLEYLKYEGIEFDEKKVVSLALFLYWFSKGKNSKDKHKCVEIIFNHLPKKRLNNGDIKDFILEGISLAIGKDALYRILTPDELKKIIEEAGNKTIEISSLDDDSKCPQLSFWNLIASDSTRTLLLFAEKEFINEQFTRYNPAELKNWEGHNKPWDYDHIIPKDWIEHRRGGISRKVKYWVYNVIGNFAAIPFTENRKKNANPSFDYYHKHREELLFDNRFIDVDKSSILDDEIPGKLADCVFDRTINIYRKCYDEIKDWIPDSSYLDDNANDRKSLFKKIQKKLQSLKKQINQTPHIYYYNPDAEWDYEITNDDQDWACNYLTIGVPLAEEAFVVAFTWGLEDNSFEVGLRKRKGLKNGRRNFNKTLKSFTDKYGESFEICKDNNFWYLCKVYNSNPKLTDVLDDMNKLLETFVK